MPDYADHDSAQQRDLDREEMDFFFGDPAFEGEPTLPRAAHLTACPFCGVELLRPVLTCPDCGVALDSDELARRGVR